MSEYYHVDFTLGILINNGDKYEENYKQKGLQIRNNAACVVGVRYDVGYRDIYTKRKLYFF